MCQPTRASVACSWLHAAITSYAHLLSALPAFSFPPRDPALGASALLSWPPRACSGSLHGGRARVSTRLLSPAACTLTSTAQMHCLPCLPRRPPGPAQRSSEAGQASAGAALLGGGGPNAAAACSASPGRASCAAGAGSAAARPGCCRLQKGAPDTLSVEQPYGRGPSTQKADPRVAADAGMGGEWAPGACSAAVCAHVGVSVGHGLRWLPASRLPC